MAPFLLLGAPPDEPPSTVVVLGAARGGTSMVAGALRILGVDMGADIDASNNEDLAFLGHRGDRLVFADPLHEERRHSYLKGIRAHITSRNERGVLWGWKDPLASYYVRDVAGLLVRPVFIAVTRDLTAIAIRENFVEKPINPGSVPAYLMNAATDYIRIIQFLAPGCHRALLLSYERALRQPQNVIRSMRELLCLREDGEAETKAASFIVPDRGSGRIA